LQTNPISPRILGFSRDEWSLAQFDDPLAAAQFLAFFDAVTSEPGRLGGLAGVGPDAILAIARVSPAFARRLRNYYASMDPDWRTNLPRSYLLGFASGPEDPRTPIIRSQWSAILSLLDGADASGST